MTSNLAKALPRCGSLSQVVVQCRMSRRLASLKTLADSIRNPPSALKGFDYPLSYNLLIEA